MKTGIDKEIYQELGLPLSFEIDKAGFSKVTFPCLCQPKYDGELNFAYFDDEGEVFLFNKAKYGRWRTDTKATNQLKKLKLPTGTILFGELHYKNNFYNGFLSHKFDDDLEFASFDTRFEFHYKNAYAVPITECLTKKHLQECFDFWIDRGFEGIVAKPNNNFTSWVKVKKTWTADLLCISADLNKEAIRLGYNGKEVCGAKVKGKNRQDLIGKIIEIEHRGIIRTNGNISMRSPIFKGICPEGKRESLT